MRKYRKVWRHLFFKFSSCGKIRARDGAEEKITTAELLKLLKYYELDLLNKDQVQEIVRKINENQSHRQDLHSLTYVGFEEFLLQASHLGYGKNGYGHLSPASMIKMLLEQMKVLTGLRGFPTAIFSCP